MFVYFSQLLNKRVVDAANREVGRIYDMAFQLPEQYPKALSDCDQGAHQAEIHHDRLGAS